MKALQIEAVRKLYLESRDHLPLPDAEIALAAFSEEGGQGDIRQWYSEALFDLITTTPTRLDVRRVREIANHFFLESILNITDDPIAECLNNIAACLPGIVTSGGNKISSDIKHHLKSQWVNAYVKELTDPAWRRAMDIGRAMAVQNLFPFSNSRMQSVGDAGARLQRHGYNMSVKECRLHLEPNVISEITKTIDDLLSELGMASAVTNVFKIAEYFHPFGFDQFLLGRRYSSGTGARDPSIPIGFLFNLAVRHKAIPQIQPKEPAEIWSSAIELARDLVAALDIEPYYNLATFNTPVVDLENVLRELARYDHCFLLRQCRINFTKTLLSDFFGNEFDQALNERFGWNIQDIIKFLREIEQHASRRPILVPVSALTRNISHRMLHSMLPHYAHEEGRVNASYLSPLDATNADLMFKPLIRAGASHVFVLPAPLIGPAMYEATMAVVRVIAKVDKLSGDGTERVVASLFKRANLNITYENAEYGSGRDNSGECDLVVEDGDLIVFVECKAKPLTRGSMAGLQGDALLDFAGGMFKAQAQALRHERLLRTAGRIEFLDGSQLVLNDRYVLRLSITLLDHGALQDRMLFANLFEALRRATLSHDPGYPKGSQVKKFNESLVSFRKETELLVHAGQSLNAQSLNAASLNVGQLDVVLDNIASLKQLRERVARPVTFSTFNPLLEYFWLKS